MSHDTDNDGQFGNAASHPDAMRRLRAESPSSLARENAPRGDELLGALVFAYTKWEATGEGADEIERIANEATLYLTSPATPAAI